MKVFIFFLCVSEVAGKAEQPLGGRSSNFHSRGNKKGRRIRAERKQEVAAVVEREGDGHASLNHLTPSHTGGSVFRALSHTHVRLHACASSISANTDCGLFRKHW